MELAGIEAVSRGARKAILCEQSKQAISIMERNIEKTHTKEKIELYHTTFERFLKLQLKEKPDIIFIDPPYDTDFAYESVKIMLQHNLLGEDSIIIIETDQEKRIIKQLETLEVQVMDIRKYGRVNLIFLSQKRKG